MGTHFERRVLAFAVLAALPSASGWAQVPAGPEFLVSASSTFAQLESRVAVDATGRFVVAWTGNENFFPVRARSFNADGTPQGPQFTVNQNTAGSHLTGGVAVDGRGNSVVVWTGDPVAGAREIAGRRFDASGAGIGSEFQVNTYTTSTQSDSRVSAAPNGNFVVAWSSDGQDGSDFGVFARRFDASGAPLATEFRVNSYTTGDQFGPFIDTDPSGDFVVVWTSDNQTGDGGLGVFGQRFTALGAPLGAEFHVNTITTGRQMAGGVARDGAGNFVVTWEGDSSTLATDDIAGQRFTAAGAPLGSEFRVNTYATGTQRNARVDSDAAGNFVVTWSSIAQLAIEDVFAQRFDSTGAARGSEFRVNSYTTDIEFGADVSTDPVGNFVITWSSFGSAVPRGVRGQRFGGLLPAAIGVDTASGPTANGNGVFEAGETVGVGPSWRNVNGAAQTFNGVASAFTGPGTSTYTLIDGTANYGTVANGTAASCVPTGDCYAVGLTVPSARPATHWDATLREDILPTVQGQAKAWVLHIGDSFADVPRTSSFYRFVETMLHRGITGGCSATQFCPSNPTSREQMAVFALVAKEGTGYVPPACGATPVFSDVPASSPFCRWIEELARRGVVSGCGTGLYCPAAAVSREQMAVFVLRTLDPALNPAACAPPNLYTDVPETSPFCRWIEELTRRAVVSGCGGGNYCPAAAVSREQMGVFIGVTFALTLYGA